jgi:hypothetical protein
MCCVGREAEKMDVVCEGELVDFLCEVRAMPIKYEEDWFAGCVFCHRLGHEALLKPLCAEKLVSPAIG